MNIAEGNGKATDGDRRRYFEIARGSALECGAVQDVLQVCGAPAADENTNRKALLDRVVAMLTKLGQRGYDVYEDPAKYASGIDPDTDSDPDADGEHEQTDRQPSDDSRFSSSRFKFGQLKAATTICAGKSWRTGWE